MDADLIVQASSPVLIRNSSMTIRHICMFAWSYLKGKLRIKITFVSEPIFFYHSRVNVDVIKERNTSFFYTANKGKCNLTEKSFTDI